MVQGDDELGCFGDIPDLNRMPAWGGAHVDLVQDVGVWQRELAGLSVCSDCVPPAVPSHYLR